MGLQGQGISGWSDRGKMMYADTGLVAIQFVPCIR